MKRISAILAILLIFAFGAAACDSPTPEEPALEQVFSLDKTEVSLAAGGDPVMLTLRVENVDEDLVWCSNREDIVEVMQSSSANRATVYARKEGQAVISVEAGELVAVCKVYVTAAPEITLLTPTLELLSDTTAFIRAEKNFEGELSYTSSNPSVADVNSEGLVTARAQGVAEITVSGGGTQAICTVTVTKPNVTLDRDSLLLAIGEETDLVAQSNGDVLWSSSDPSVATVDKGHVKALSVGETKITAQYGNAQAVCTVKVKEVVLTLTLSEQEKTIESGGSFSLTATLSPAQTGDDARILWTVEEGEDLVSVSENGLVTSLGGAGDAIVRATSAKDTDAYAQCRVHIPAPYEGWIAISDAAGLRAALMSGNEAKNMYLTSDIDLGGEALVSTLASFSGIFDGCGHSITNFRCGVLFGNAPGEQGGLQTDGIVRRLSLQCTLSELGGNLGLFGMEMRGTVENCFFDVTFGTITYQSVFARNALGSAKITNTIIVAQNPNHTQFTFAGPVQGGGTWQNVYYCTDDGSVGGNGPEKKSEDELKSAALFGEWDPEVWEIAEGELPRLKHTSLA